MTMLHASSAPLPAPQQLRNGTPHEVVIYAGTAVEQVLAPSGFVFGSQDDYGLVAELMTPDGPVPITGIIRRTLLFGRPGPRVRIAEPLPVPGEEPGVLWVVSAHTAAAAPERRDFLTPGQPVYGPTGRQLGCQGLRNPRI
ncbi:hypothetical protein [Deinococcus multiflagellatus]|uniref:Uncharacterized protein n=1 Tax=Deinococcus multiflagellatus TaxID=1656887 RepID=A0ABW1ZRP1_9DEIO|nr:hypothetical protein [Deinococcus multiflagellatus]MBZ9714429.1 hypothetical protein [Deinococcus multiflagellatus]